MGKSNRLRLSEVRQAVRLAGECRDLGRDVNAWFTHALRGAKELLRANVVLGGLSSPQGFYLQKQVTLLLSVGWESSAQEQTALGYLATEAHLSDPAFQRYQAIARPNITLRPLQLISRAEFEASEYHAVRRSFDIQDLMFSQRQTTNRTATFSFSPQRPPGDPDFDARALKLLNLFHDELAMLAGKVLSAVPTDSLVGLTPRLREALTFLLAGDSEKQVAKAMKISRNTAHEYVTLLYRHFRVNSRAGLLALCRDRGITNG